MLGCTCVTPILEDGQCPTSSLFLLLSMVSSSINTIHKFDSNRMCSRVPILNCSAAPPTVRLREEVQKVIAGPETNVSLLCLVDGLPKPVINWTL